MMHEDADDDDEDVILDRRTLIHQSNDVNSTSNSGPILLGVNRFNIKVYDNPVKLSQTKAILLATTCVSIGMFIGILGPTFPFLAQNMPADLSAIIWLIALKAIGFLIGTFLSAYLYSWFNICCLLGLSCLAISFGVCSLPMINDLATFYLTSLILGIGLAISYHGIDTLYNRLWTRPSLASVRWLHLLVAFGAIISTLMLFPSAYSIKNEILTTTSISQNVRPRREAVNEVANLLASMSSEDDFLNITDVFNQSNDSFSIITTTTTTTEKIILKPSLVETDILKQSQAVKPTETDQSKIKPLCMKFFCCYHYNETNQNETIKNNTFSCQENDDKSSDVCKDVVASCQISTSSICLIEKTNTGCRIDQMCTDSKQPECSILLIETESMQNASKYITTTQLTSTTIATTATKLPSTAIITTVPTTTTTTATTVTTTTTTTTTTTQSTTPRKKPSMAESDRDDLSENLFYKKLGSFVHSITSFKLIYLFLAFTFFLLGIFYSTLAMRGEGANPSSIKSTNSNSFSLLFGNSHRTMTNSNNRLSLFSDRASLKFVFLLISFYFIMSGIENSCIYLIYLFGIELKYNDHQSLTLQFLFFVGLLFGRLIDILMDYGCFLFNTRITNRTKKQSDKFHLISIKFCILIRLILLVILCSTLSFSHLFQQNLPTTTNASIPSIQMFYFIFFLIGLLIASLPTLVLFWIERDLNLNDSLIRILSITITISEIIFPSFLFYTIKHVVLSYLFYLFIGSCLLLILFILILLSSKKWQRKRMYRILPTSIDMEEISIENHSDSNDDNDDLRNEQINFDNERTKTLKEH